MGAGDDSGVGSGPRPLVVAVVTVAVCAVLLLAGARQQISSDPLPGAERVLLIGVPGLRIDDLRDAAFPALRQMADQGSVAAMTARTRSARPSSAEAYATIGAGSRVFVSRLASVAAYEADEPLEASSAADVAARRMGQPVDGAVVVPNAAAIRRDAGDNLSTGPGALGSALEAAGLRTAVVANSDTRTDAGGPVTATPAALAAMDSLGGVDHGIVDRSTLLVEDQSEPFALRADLDAFTGAISDAVDAAEFVVVDLGDTERALAYVDVSTPEAAEATRRRAIGHVDTLVGRLLAGELHTGGDRTLVLVVGVRGASAELELPPVLAWGTGIAGATLHSPSTKRPGLVTITDLAPTVLDSLGAGVPDGMIGAPLRTRSGAPDLDALERLDRLAASRELVYYPAVVAMLAVQAIGLAAVAAAYPLTQRAASAARLVALSMAAWPFATFAERAIPRIEEAGVARHAVIWAIAIATAIVALAAARRLARRGLDSPLTALGLVATATVVLLIADVATGATLQVASILGYTPHAAARYTGFGNTAFAALAASAVIAVAVANDGRRARGRGLAVTVAVLTVVVVVDAWPTLGSDVGGVLAMVPAFAILIAMLDGRRPSWRLVGAGVAATVLALGTITLVDVARPAESRSHLGRLVMSSGGDDATLWTTIARKASVNAGLFGATIWTWMLPIAGVFAVWAFARAGADRRFPRGSPRRAGLVTLVAVGVLGGLVNDSGVVVTGAVLVFLGPYLALGLLGGAPAHEAEGPPSGR